jgi:hypothetical protein
MILSLIGNPTGPAIKGIEIRGLPPNYKSACSPPIINPISMTRRKTKKKQKRNSRRHRPRDRVSLAASNPV